MHDVVRDFLSAASGKKLAADEDHRLRHASGFRFVAGVVWVAGARLGRQQGDGPIAALECATGKVVWKHERPQVPNYTSPIILKIDGKDQLCSSAATWSPVATR